MSVPHKDLIDHFFGTTSSSPDISIYDDIPCSTCSPAEVLFKLKWCKNTAPGPDRLTYNH